VPDVNYIDEVADVMYWQAYLYISDSRSITRLN